MTGALTTMVYESVPNTPIRRSTRKSHQPGVQTSPEARSGASYKWHGEPIYTRTVQSQPTYASTDESEGEEDGQWDAPFYGGVARLREDTGKGKRKPSQETFKVGDTVLVNTSARYPSVGVIVELWQEGLAETSSHPESAMKVKVHWFLRPNELAAVRASRSHQKVSLRFDLQRCANDLTQNEIYYSISSSDVVTPNEIRSRCTVGSKPAARRRRKGSDSGSGSDDENDSFECTHAVDPAKGIYYRFDWEKHRAATLKLGSQDDEGAWNVHVSEPIQKPKQRMQDEVDEAEESGDDSEDDFHLEESEEGSEDELALAESDAMELDSIPEEDEEGLEDLNDVVSRTPSKRKGKTRTVKSTPSRSRKQSKAAPTPHSKAALRLRQKKRKPHHIKSLRPVFPENIVDLSGLPKDAYLRSMHLLHVGSRPDALPCREDEFVEVLGHVVDLVEEGAGGCVC